MISEDELLILKIKKDNGVKLSKEEKKFLKENSKEEQEKKSKMSIGERLKQASNIKYAQLMGDDEVDNFPIREYIPSTNLMINSQISGSPFLGHPSGRILQLAGPESVGKSMLALDFLKNAQKMGYFGIIYDSEFASNDKTELKSKGIDTERLLYIPVNTVEILKTSILNILNDIQKDERVYIIVDSVGNLSTSKEMADSTEGNSTRDMTRAGQLKALFRTITIQAGLKNVPIIIVNHTYANLSGGLYASDIISGGSGSLYNSSIILTFSKAQNKDSNGKVTGSYITSTTQKCRTAKERTKVKFLIDFSGGIQKYSGMDLFCIDNKVLEKSGGHYFINQDSMKIFNEEKIKLTPEIYDRLLENGLDKILHNYFHYSDITEQIIGDSEENS